MNQKRALSFLVALLLFCGFHQVLAADEVPDTILYNGKIVTVDDHSFTDNLGTIAQALAIKGDFILAIGNNTRIHGMAGPKTKLIDLKGREVLPGFAATHDHPDQWDLLNPRLVKKVITDDIHIERFMDDPPAQQLQEFPRVLDEAAHKAKPGQWIRISMLYGDEYRWGREISGYFGRQINKQMLDLAAPNNPVIVRGGFTGAVVNTRALEILRKYYGSEWNLFPSDSNPLSAGVADREEVTVKTGACAVCYRYFEMDVIFTPEQLAKIYELGLSWLAGYGQTLNASNMYTAGSMAAYTILGRSNRLPIRFAYTWYWPPRKDLFLDTYFDRMLAAQVGMGTDYFWFLGGNPVSNLGACSTLPGTSPAVKEREKQEKCLLADDTEDGKTNREILANWIKAGGRFSGAHTGGDADIDNLLNVIEQASKDAGMTPEQIRAHRHAYDHMAMNPRPDQIQRLKQLGMMVGGWNLAIWEGSAEQIYKNYGEKAVEWMQPRKNLDDAGVMNSIEIDRPIGYTKLNYFTVMYTGITRKDQDGKVWGPSQAVSRELMLKSATIWGAYYALRENNFGSLEPGKWADLTVLDKDYLTIPIVDLQKLRVLMTMVGGKVVHLVPSLAKEIGMQPTGAQVELGGPPAQW